MEQPATMKWPAVRHIDDGTVLLVDRVDTVAVALHADEQVYAHAMTPQRRRQFSVGRALARSAVTLLLGQPVNIGIRVGTAGEPIWPDGISGSLSHTTTHVAALVARRGYHASVGIDLDDARLIGPAAADLMTDEESEAVMAKGWASAIALAQNIVFSAKEALFKYQYPLTGNGDLDFDEVRLKAFLNEPCLRAESVLSDVKLASTLSTARIYFEQIQRLRLCWVVSGPCPNP